MAVPIALLSLLYADVGVSIFGRAAFGRAAQNVQWLSPFILLVYLSMPIGTLLLAARRQRAWTLVQTATLLVSLGLDPLLVGWFQARTGNGGLGICIAMLVSESVMIAGGLSLMPRGMLGRSLAISMLQASFAGACMAAVGLLLAHWNPFVAAPLALVGYVAGLWLGGALEQERFDQLKEMLARKGRQP